MNKPVAEACLRNQAPIAEALKDIFNRPGQVLEIGSGTGQHAVYIARELSHVMWQPTDVEGTLAGINAWRLEAGLSNVLTPVALDVLQPDWPVKGPYDGVFTANTIHFISWDAVRAMFAGVAGVLKQQGAFCIYGPFNRDGHYTSDGNRHLDAWLKSRDPASGIKDIHAVIECATEYDLLFSEEKQLPANNLLLRFQRA
jgi:cyclopropane fatty-acyl-phospholipid synthase-like methyltransferase